MFPLESEQPQYTNVMFLYRNCARRISKTDFEDMSMEIIRIGNISLKWGEGLLWDEISERLYFVDCATSELHWLENAELPLNTIILPSMPTGIGLATDGRLVVALDAGIYFLEPDKQSYELLSNYPTKMGRRANDLTVDSTGAIITGSLNEPGNGSYWWFSSQGGWQMIDSDISNTNGPVSLRCGDVITLVIADTPARKLYAYDYTPQERIALNKRIFANTVGLEGYPDGACASADGGILSCILGSGKIGYFTSSGLQQVYEAGSEQPTDVAFGGRNLDRMFITSIGIESKYGKPLSKLAGSLVEIRGTGLSGVKENRFNIGT
jgi:sugar lactone lactonase YvrE